MIVQLYCEGPHTGKPPTLGTTELDDDMPQVMVDQAVSGHLCEDCGYAWTVLTGQYAQGLPGLPPRARMFAADVDTVLQQHGKARKHLR